ncbi:hypothetical protein K6U06_06670 [Acidiferrimicrobium sp. IK]|uniref:hypothetical protein n=1 Tax=Acidiferrimicrobium sp. IK TaxID=2871700 RepID=UPI0021CB5ACB|nr:hypothetical protein [Acidiferrimicrobium sp. IK]MCU4184037.1 hypothetical protein [Acidiferrimicrobium sp. IK]
MATDAPVIPVDALSAEIGPPLSLTADTGTPTWLTHALTVLLPVVAVVLAVWQPGNVKLSAASQAAVIVGGLVLAAALHAVHLITRNGLSKAGLTKTITEEEQWVKANIDTLKSVATQAKPLLDSIPGGPAALATMQSDLADVKARVGQVPQTDRAAIAEVVKELVIPNVLAASPAAAPPAS